MADNQSRIRINLYSGILQYNIHVIVFSVLTEVTIPDIRHAKPLLIDRLCEKIRKSTHISSSKDDFSPVVNPFSSVQMLY